MNQTMTPEALQRAMAAACKAGDYAELPSRVYDALIAGWHELLAAQPQLNTQEARPLTDEKGRPVTYWGGKAAQPASSAGGQEPVAVVGADFTLFWAGSGPIAPLIKRHGIKVGDPLYAAPVAGEAAEMSPEFTDTARAAIAWVLWHHQGGSSAVGQPLRYALGMGDHDPLNDRQIAEAKRYATLVGAKTEDFRQPAPAAVPVDAVRELAESQSAYDAAKAAYRKVSEAVSAAGGRAACGAAYDVECRARDRRDAAIAALIAAATQPAAQGVDLGHLRQLRDQFLSWSNSCSASDNAAAAFEQAAETLGELIDSQHQQKEPTHG